PAESTERQGDGRGETAQCRRRAVAPAPLSTLPGRKRRSTRSAVPRSPGGMQLKRYQLIAELGRGGTADVFLAVARGPSGFNKLVVVKSLRAGDDELVDMFLDEGRLAARLNHPNVVQ